jgi:Ca2+-transporting ATPase
VAQWHTLSPETVLEKLNTDKTNGLAADEAGQRIKDYGPNEIIETGRRTAWNMVLDQFRDFMVIILLIAALISGILGEIADSIVIMAIVILNAVLGVVQESKAEKSLAALKKMAAPNARVLRARLFPGI